MGTIGNRKIPSDKGTKRGPKKPLKPKPVVIEEPPMSTPANDTISPHIAPEPIAEVTPKIMLIDKHDRCSLSEGRVYGIGFAFCKKEGSTFTCVGPVSTCKDYLNEVVFTENTKVSSQAWGYKATYAGCFDKDFAYLVICVMGAKRRIYDTITKTYIQDPKKPEDKHPTFDKEFEYLRDNFARVQSLLNEAEEYLKVPGRSKIEPVPDSSGRFIVSVPVWWVQYTYLTSLYALIIRIAVTSYYKEGSIADVLTKCRTEDSVYAANAKVKMDKMASGHLFKQVFDLNNPSGHHSLGINWAPI